MLEFKKLCDSFERLTPAERGILLSEKSITILARLHSVSLPGMDPIAVLAGFVIGSSAADGRLNEKEYLMMYPALVRVFGDDFDFNSVKESFRWDIDGRRTIIRHTEDMIKLLDLLDDELKYDIIMLCLCIVSIDGKVRLKEKRYIWRLCEACQ